MYSCVFNSSGLLAAVAVFVGAAVATGAVASVLVCASNPVPPLKHTKTNPAIHFLLIHPLPSSTCLRDSTRTKSEAFSRPQYSNPPTQSSPAAPLSLRTFPPTASLRVPSSASSSFLQRNHLTFPPRVYSSLQPRTRTS